MVVLVHGNDGSEACSERLHMLEVEEKIKGVKNVKKLREASHGE